VTEEFVVANKARVGMRVRVHECYRKQHLQGLHGVITQKCVLAGNVAFTVGHGDGLTDMFWDHELEEAQIPSVGF
jgi:hypothetical protein